MLRNLGNTEPHLLTNSLQILQASHSDCHHSLRKLSPSSFHQIYSNLPESIPMVDGKEGVATNYRALAIICEVGQDLAEFSSAINTRAVFESHSPMMLSFGIAVCVSMR